MGPGFCVYLPAPLCTEDADYIHTLLTQHTNSLRRQGIHWEIWFKEDSCRCSLAIVPFGAESAGDGKAVEDYFEAGEVFLEEDERLAYEKALGYCPVTTIQFINFCGGRYAENKLLSQFAALIARKYNGVVDLRGAFDYYGKGDKSLEPDIIKSGTYYTVSFLPGYKEYLADADFMDEWIQHPDFRLRD